MPTTIPATPTEVTTLLWIALFVLVPALSGVIVYLWRQNTKLRDQREQDLKEALSKEKAENEKQGALLEKYNTNLELIAEQLKKQRSK